MLTDHTSFTISDVAGHLGWFCDLAIVNSVSVKLTVYLSFLSAIFGSFNSVPRCGRSGPYQDYIFSSAEFWLIKWFWEGITLCLSPNLAWNLPCSHGWTQSMVLLPASITDMYHDADCTVSTLRSLHSICTSYIPTNVVQFSMSCTSSAAFDCLMIDILFVRCFSFLSGFGELCSVWFQLAFTVPQRKV